MYCVFVGVCSARTPGYGDKTGICPIVRSLSFSLSLAAFGRRRQKLLAGDELPSDRHSGEGQGGLLETALNSMAPSACCFVCES